MRFLYILIWNNFQDTISNGEKAKDAYMLPFSLKMEKEYIFSVFVNIKNHLKSTEIDKTSALKENGKVRDSIGKSISQILQMLSLSLIYFIVNYVNKMAKIRYPFYKKLHQGLF